MKLFNMVNDFAKNKSYVCYILYTSISMSTYVQVYVTFVKNKGCSIKGYNLCIYYFNVEYLFFKR